MNRTDIETHKVAQRPPRSFEELRHYIAATQTELPKRLAQAAHFALARPDDVALGTAASVAKAAEVQPSTLVRLARHLGYEGFSDFQMIFRDRLKYRASSYEERLRKIERGVNGDSYESVLLNGFFNAARQSIDSLSSAINPSDFARCTGILADSEIIYLVARRRAYPLVAQMSYTFANLGIKTVTVGSSSGIDAEIIKLATQNDAVIACSFAPYTNETLAQAQTLSEAGVPLVAITDTALSPLTSCATCWLEVAETDFNGFRSLSASMALSMALPVAVAERRRWRS